MESTQRNILSGFTVSQPDTVRDTSAGATTAVEEPLDTSPVHEEMLVPPAGVKAHHRMLWATLLLVALPVLVLHFLGKLVHHSPSPVPGVAPTESLVDGEERISQEETVEPVPPPLEYGKDQLAPADEEESKSIEKVHPPKLSPFRNNRKLQDLLLWIAQSKFAEKLDWRQALKDAFDATESVSDVRDVILGRNCRKEVVIRHKKNRIRLSAFLFGLQPGWNGPEAAEEMGDKLLEALDKVLNPAFLSSSPLRQLTVRVGDDQGTAVVTITVSKVNPDARRSVPVQLEKILSSTDSPVKPDQEQESMN